jgi:PilZ domain-containing protein
MYCNLSVRRLEGNVLPFFESRPMPLPRMDAYTNRRAGKDSVCAESEFRPERRQRRRTPIRWPLRLLRDDGLPAIETFTQNLSSSGFYCLSPVPLIAGETLQCTLHVPTYDPHDQGRQIGLECAALVVRAEATADNLYGVACHIEDYHLPGAQENGINGSR